MDCAGRSEKSQDQSLRPHPEVLGVGLTSFIFPSSLEMLFPLEKGLHFMKFATRLHPYL